MKEVITEEQEAMFLKATEGLCSWEQLVDFAGPRGDIVKPENVTFDEALHLLAIDYIAMPF